MAEVLHNRKNLSFVIHATANATITIAGNNSVSNVAIDDEVLTGATIKQVWYGSSGHWVVKRGSNTVAVFNTSGTANFYGTGMALTKDQTENLVLELVDTANGYIMIEMQKVGSLARTY